MKELETNDLSNLKGYSLIDFYATWCGPCTVLKPILEKIEKEYDDINFYSIDIDNNKDLIKEYNISSVPTVLFLEDGEIISSSVGFIPEKMITNFIQKCKG